MQVVRAKGFEAQKALSQYVESHGVKQSAIARALGIRPHRVHEIMRLKTEMKASEFLLICRFLDKEPNFFDKTE